VARVTGDAGERTGGAVLRRLAPALVLMAVTVLAHAWELSGTFVYDDYAYVVDNAAVQAGLSDWTRFFTEPDTYAENKTHHYRPLVTLSYAADVALGGEGTFPFKATQLGLHLLTVLALFGLVRTLGRSVPGLPPGTAFAAALWMGIAPFNVDAVHYITARSSVLCGLFAVVSVTCFVRMRQARGPAALGWYGAHLAALALSVTSKETGLAVPAVLVAADLLLLRPAMPPEARRAGRLWWPYLPYAAGGFAAWLLMPNVHRVLSHPGQVFGDEGRLAAAIRCLAENLRLMALPTDLSITHPIGPTMRLAEPATIVSALLVAALVAGAWRVRRAAPLVTFGLAWYLLLIAPSTFVHLTEILQEHRGYPASMGVGMAIGWGAAWLWGAAGRRRAWAAAGLAAVLALLLAGTVHRERAWVDDVTLWTRALAVDPTSARAWVSLGTHYEREERPDLAEQAFRKGLAFDPTWTDVVVELGRIYAASDRPEAAERMFLHAHRMVPDAKPAFGDLLRFYEQTGQIGKLVPLYEEALRRWPRMAAETHLALAGVQRRLGALPEAEAEARKALALRPDWAPAVMELGRQARARGDAAEAVRRFQEAARLEPATAGYRVALGDALVTAGRAEEGVAVLAAVADAFPDASAPQFALARALDAAGRPEDAAARYRRFLALEPGPEMAGDVEAAEARLARTGPESPGTVAP
jgi:tetratricopeptide (TPR) repeat protein